MSSDAKTTVDRLAEVERLAKLPVLDADAEIKASAKKLGVSPTTLRDEVKRARKATAPDSMQGSAINIEDIAPIATDKPLDGPLILDCIVGLFRQYTIIEDAVADAAALWTMSTYCLDWSAYAARAHISSPMPRCGKTTLLTMLGWLAQRAKLTSNISSSALYRTIEMYRPTLIVDEVDSFLDMNEDMRGILNAGHSRNAAYVTKNAPTPDGGYEPRDFCVYGFIALATIGKKVPATVIDSSVSLPMRRRRPDDRKPPRLPRPREDDDFHELRPFMARWALDNRTELERLQADDSFPAGLDELHDRAANNWLLPLAIAELAGGDWPKRARNAALVLSAAQEEAAADGIGGIALTLLGDIRDYFKVEGNPERVATLDVAEHLHRLEERPWAAYGKSGKAISRHQIGRLLASFDIKSKDERVADRGVMKCYVLAQLQDAFARYLPEPPRVVRKVAPKVAPVRRKS